MAIQNTVLTSENEGLLDVLTVKRKREMNGKPLDLLQHYEYWGPSMMWIRSSRVAKELSKASNLYNKKIEQKKHDIRAKQKEERDQLKAKKGKEVAERKAQRERQ
ncbi:DBINO domain containing protein, partial [Pyrenophora tritici-repentis]